jgi:hypothetical protein
MLWGFEGSRVKEALHERERWGGPHALRGREARVAMPCGGPSARLGGRDPRRVVGEEGPNGAGPNDALGLLRGPVWPCHVAGLARA